MCDKKIVRAKQLYDVLPTLQAFIVGLLDIWMTIPFKKILVINDFSDPYGRF
jgi:hypothetical protein